MRGVNVFGRQSAQRQRLLMLTALKKFRKPSSKRLGMSACSTAANSVPYCSGDLYEGFVALLPEHLVEMSWTGHLTSTLKQPKPISIASQECWCILCYACCKGSSFGVYIICVQRAEEAIAFTMRTKDKKYGPPAVEYNATSLLCRQDYL